ncbi:MAG: NAD-dependent epimerase/dehydratase [Verrucomicrobiales bacterium]|nr:NAD-dependent epimerase/dehydratase [Verrucomicrobiales bacterium]
MRVLIVGCGYVGLPLGIELIRLGHEVTGVTKTGNRSNELQQAGIQPLIADIADRESLNQLPTGFDWVVNTTSSGHGGLAEYQRVYLEGMRNLIDWLSAVPPQKFVYTSSTSVYGQTDGSLVKEGSITQPVSETAQILVQAENELFKAMREKKFPAIIMRVAGIYGPDRGHLFNKVVKEEDPLPGKSDKLLNMIHRDDVVGCIVTALKNGRGGEIYNTVDDEPVPQIHFVRWLSETLGVNMPEFDPEAEPPQSKRAATQKKVLNRKLRMELGCQLKYPTFRQGYTAEIQRLQDAGKL